MPQAPARVTALLRHRSPAFSGYDEFIFDPPRDLARSESAEDAEENDAGRGDGSQLVADKLPLTTDRNGAASVTLKNLPKLTRASELVTELTFNDPNGEVQTAATRIALWPSAVVLG